MRYRKRDVKQDAGEPSRRLKMKDLQALSGLSKQAIHYYLREGLLPPPDRPKANVAFYSDEHVVRLAAIKQLQRERSLSLGQIRTMLEKFDYTALSFTEDLGNFEMALHARVDGDLPSHDKSLREASESTGLSEAELRDLHRIGLIHIKVDAGRSLLDFRDVGIAECWARLMRAGYAGNAAFGERFIQPYVKALLPIADYVVDSFFREFGESPTAEAVELAAQGTAITNELLVRLHTQALMRATRARIERDAETRRGQDEPAVTAPPADASPHVATRTRRVGRGKRARHGALRDPSAAGQPGTSSEDLV